MWAQGGKVQCENDPGQIARSKCADDREIQYLLGYRPYTVLRATSMPSVETAARQLSLHRGKDREGLPLCPLSMPELLADA